MLDRWRAAILPLGGRWINDNKNLLDRWWAAVLPLSGMPILDRQIADGQKYSGPLEDADSGPTRLPVDDH